jgi:TatD DNase family protein
VVDTHCHLDSCKAPASELIERARAAGLTRIATVGMDDETIARAIELATEHDDVFAIAGRHPHNTAGFDEAGLERIERAARSSERVRAIGETGLDYFRHRAPREDQRRAFEAQIDLAARLGLPLVIHTREAEEDTFALLAERASELTVVLHCFSAPARSRSRANVSSSAARVWITSGSSSRTARSI